MKPPRSSVWPMMSPILPLVAALAFPTFPLIAQEAEKSAPAPAPLMRETSPGVFEMGTLRIDKNTRSVHFAAKVNMTEGNLEYLICTPRGSTHESLIVTDVNPNDIHFAMLLLDAKGAGILAPAPGDAPPAQINADYLKSAPRLKGDSVRISAKWKDAAGKESSVPIEDWVLDTRANKSAARGPWLYTGSMFADNQFLAQLQGMVASIVINPASLINNPRKGNDNDQVWVANTRAIPAVETPIEITFKLESSPALETK